MDCWIVCGTCEEPDREMRCGLKCPEGQGLGEFASSSGLISWKARIAILHSALILETVERDGWLLNYLVLPEPALLFATSAIWMQPGLDGRSQMHPRSHEPAHPSLLAHRFSIASAVCISSCVGPRIATTTTGVTLLIKSNPSTLR